MTELKTANIDMVNPEMADIQVEGTERSDFLLKGALAGRRHLRTGRDQSFRPRSIGQGRWNQG